MRKAGSRSGLSYFSSRLRFRESRRRLFRREAAVEGFSLRGHLLEELRRGEARAVFRFQLVAKLDELLGTHEVDVGQRATGERREAEAEDRADIRLTRIGDDVVLHRARGLHRLHHQEALLQLLDVEGIRIELLGLQRGQARPQALLTLALLGVVVKTLAVLAA